MNRCCFVLDRSEGYSGRGGRGRGEDDGGRRGRGGRGGGRGGRNNRDDDSHVPGQAKPSTNVSLFDFLEEKLPEQTETTSKSKNAAVEGGASAGARSHPGKNSFKDLNNTNFYNIWTNLSFFAIFIDFGLL